VSPGAPAGMVKGMDVPIRSNPGPVRSNPGSRGAPTTARAVPAASSRSEIAATVTHSRAEGFPARRLWGTWIAICMNIPFLGRDPAQLEPLSSDS
jgi:hypothetical protein